MMKMTKVILRISYLITALYFAPLCSMGAGIYRDGDQLRNVNIVGKVLDTNINSFPRAETSVKILVSKYPFNGILMNRGPHKSYTSKVKYGETFNFTFPALAKRFYMQISYRAKSGSEHWQSTLYNVYILESGDDIQCTLTNSAFYFSGKGSEKLNCQTEIYKVIPKLSPELLQSGNYQTRYAVTERKRDSCLVLRRQIVEKYRPKLGDELSNIFLANCIGLRYWPSLQLHRSIGQGAPKEYKAFTETEMYKSIDSRISSRLPPEALVGSPLYTDAVMEKIIMQNRRFVEGKLENSFSKELIQRVFDHVIASYEGMVREKLLAGLFLMWANVSSIDLYYDKALSVVKDSDYRELITDAMEKNMKGKDFYPFELKDINGKWVALKDLGGKVLIVDFWYTGCGGCANLKSAMEPVWEAYKSHPKVVFVSISIDKNEAVWKESVRSGIYTDPDALNLYTNGLGKDHPMIGKQRITSYPRAYLLKNGKIYSGNLPYPDGADLKSGNTGRLIELIESAIEN